MKEEKITQFVSSPSCEKRMNDEREGGKKGGEEKDIQMKGTKD